MAEKSERKSEKKDVPKKVKKKAEESSQKGKEIRKAVPPRLKNYYLEHVVPNLKKTFQYSNIMEIPKIEKISVNIGLGKATQNPKLVEYAMRELNTICGQKAVPAKAKKSISNFKLRQGTHIGCRVTLRGNIMYEFFDRLISVAIPRVRDFRGISDKSFDGRGNFSLGIREHIIFPEISYDKVETMLGMNITIVTTAKTDKEAYELLKEFGFPFRRA